MAVTIATNPDEGIREEPHHYFGLASDTKPTIASPGSVPPPTIGSTFTEYDTDIVSITYDGTNWVVKDLLVRLVAGTAAFGKLAANSGVDIGDVDVTSISAGNNRIGTVSVVGKAVAVEQVIDGSLGAYLAGDVVSADDCCTTLAITWQFDVARAVGEYVWIVGAILFNETENQAVQYDFKLFNATPTGELRDNAADDNPVKADISKYLGKISFPFSVAEGATVATNTEAVPSPITGLPKLVKCAAADTKIYGVLKTNTAYTQTATDKIRITLLVEQL